MPYYKVEWEICGQQGVTEGQFIDEGQAEHYALMDALAEAEQAFSCVVQPYDEDEEEYRW